MSLFSFNKGKLSKIKRINFKLEKNIQKITENNLNEIFGLEFVKSEFKLNKLRIDSLAFDSQAKSFVIIEYKREKNFSVIDQGYAYLALLLNNKADFILEYNENKDKLLKKSDIDWTQSKVIFISPQFTEYQQQAIEFKDLPIELWEISQFENNTVLFNQLKSPDTSESINTVSSGSKVVQEVSKEVKVYNESDHLKVTSPALKELYENLKSRILELGENIEVKTFKIYIGFIASTNFADIHIYKNSIKIWINLPKGRLDDPQNISRDVSDVGHWGNGDYEISLSSLDDLGYIMTLIKQSYETNSN